MEQEITLNEVMSLLNKAQKDQSYICSFEMCDDWSGFISYESMCGGKEYIYEWNNKNKLLSLLQKELKDSTQEG